jgi:branched-chain amino acid aminotransferase
MNGKLVKWDDARIHILSHVIHYGSSVFEGMRVYKTAKGSAAFRLHDHTARLFNSASIYYMNIPFTHDEINRAIMETIAANKMDQCYVRPLVYRGYGKVGVDPAGSPTDVAIAVWDWGKYLGPEALEKGIAVCVSSWRRPAPDTFPAVAKSGANYMNSQLIKLEARRNGFVEAIALDTYGYVSEGSGENVFVVYKGRVMTPSLGSAILPGITRESVMTLARQLGYEIVEQNIPRDLLYVAEEVFLTGSAAEITPVTKIDDIKIGTGSCGPITRALQKAFFDVVENGNDPFGWLTFVGKPVGAAVTV